MARQYSIAQARDHLPSIVHAVECGEPVELTRRGTAVAVVMSLEDYRRASGGRRSYASALATFLATTNLEELGITDDDLAGLRDQSPGRDFRW